jgi:hypothetical protein
MQFIEIKTDDDSVFINVGNIVYIVERPTPLGKVPVLFMMNGMAFAVTGHTTDEIMSLIEQPNGPKTEVPEAFLKSFEDVFPDASNSPAPEVDIEPEEGVVYRDGDDDERSDDDFLPS